MWRFSSGGPVWGWGEARKDGEKEQERERGDEERGREGEQERGRDGVSLLLNTV